MNIYFAKMYSINIGHYILDFQLVLPLPKMSSFAVNNFISTLLFVLFCCLTSTVTAQYWGSYGTGYDPGNGIGSGATSLFGGGYLMCANCGRG
uniref:Uncharacterized protein n=1 Tax=Panagrellus redivivus TaxID=6233 RepID=A0A7E4ZV53_PANRE